MTEGAAIADALESVALAIDRMPSPESLTGCGLARGAHLTDVVAELASQQERTANALYAIAEAIAGSK